MCKRVWNFGKYFAKFKSELPTRFFEFEDWVIKLLMLCECLFEASIRFLELQCNRLITKFDSNYQVKNIKNRRCDFTNKTSLYLRSLSLAADNKMVLEIGKWTCYFSVPQKIEQSAETRREKWLSSSSLIWPSNKYQKWEGVEKKHKYGTS